MRFPRAETYVSGLLVGEDVPNASSIPASLGRKYRELPGIREVPRRLFQSSPHELFYAADDFRRTIDLARRIKNSGRIDPLIVIIDGAGPYILEGAHRLGALHLLRKKTFPALVVIDENEGR